MKYTPCEKYCREYLRYLGIAKTERRSYAESVRLLEAKGFREIASFKTLKADYIEALFETRDMRKATMAAFGGKEKLQLFVSEWLRFWKER